MFGGRLGYATFSLSGIPRSGPAEESPPPVSRNTGREVEQHVSGMHDLGKGRDATPRAADARDFPARSAPQANSTGELAEALVTCRACPRLVAWREEAAQARPRAFGDWTYWARPVPGFGPPDASLLIIGLAPAAHGGNRTGRVFTGDPSGDALFAALHELGLASQPSATHRGDGMELYGVRISLPVHCAPPGNRPTVTERDTCQPWLNRELELLGPTLRAVVALGAFGWQAALRVLAHAGWRVPRPRPAFGHGAEALLGADHGERRVHLVGGYHPSQRNMFTRTLTPAMLRDVLRRGATLAGLPGHPHRGGTGG